MSILCLIQFTFPGECHTFRWDRHTTRRGLLYLHGGTYLPPRGDRYIGILDLSLRSCQQIGYLHIHPLSFSLLNRIDILYTAHYANNLLMPHYIKKFLYTGNFAGNWVEFQVCFLFFAPLDFYGFVVILYMALLNHKKQRGL